MTGLTTRVQNVAEILDIIQMLDGKTTGYFRAFKTNFFEADKVYMRHI